MGSKLDSSSLAYGAALLAKDGATIAGMKRNGNANALGRAIVIHTKYFRYNDDHIQATCEHPVKTVSPLLVDVIRLSRNSMFWQSCVESIFLLRCTVALLQLPRVLGQGNERFSRETPLGCVCLTSRFEAFSWATDCPRLTAAFRVKYWPKWCAIENL